MAWRNEYADSLHKVLIDTPSGTIECVGGSYAGVPFFVEETASSGGREVVTKPLPFSDSHVNEDVGKKVLSISCNMTASFINQAQNISQLQKILNTTTNITKIYAKYAISKCNKFKI